MQMEVVVRRILTKLLTRVHVERLGFGHQELGGEMDWFCWLYFRIDDYTFEQISLTDEKFLGFYSQGETRVETTVTETELVPVEVY